MYRSGLILLVHALLFCVLSGCITQDNLRLSASPTGDPEIPSSSKLLKEAEQHYTAIFLANYPMLSTMLQPPPELAGGEYDNRLGDYSPRAFKLFRQNMNEARETFKNLLKADDLTDHERQNASILHNMFSMYAGSPDFTGGFIHYWGGQPPYIINPQYTPLNWLPTAMQYQQPVTNESEVHAYLQRLNAVDEFVDSIIAKYQFDIEQGVILPKKLHPKTLLFFDKFLASPANEHELVTTFAERIALIDDMDEEIKKRALTRAAELVETVVYPAYQRARQAVVNSEPLARDDDGLWSQRAGDLAYLYEVEFLGDTELSPEQIHKLGLEEVNRITALMEPLLNDIGLIQGTVGERMLKLLEYPGQVYPNTDLGRAALLEYVNTLIDEVMSKSPAIYGTIPEQSVEVRRIPEVSEASSSAGYYTSPSLDGSRPGIFWINLRDMESVSKIRLKTLTFHEAVPGHHFQIALNMNQEVGLLRQNSPYNAYSEGWGLYAEYAASEHLGMYKDDDLGNLGRLQAELYRAARLVVDTGLHYKKWTREQAIDYFHSVTGSPLSDVESEIERYMALPGQALGYKMGMITFVELEREARARLGPNYDIKAFHDVILLPGARPMSMVKEDVANWIAHQTQ